jgi:protein-S-isoprenylcysteine O-methyltransferase Ste14
MKHPMYLGNALFIAGLGGYAAGPANALALGAVTDLVQRHWIHLEEGSA